MTDIAKPAPQTQVYFDYNDCVDYIEAKHGIQTRDYGGLFTTYAAKSAAIRLRVYAELGVERGFSPKAVEDIRQKGYESMSLGAADFFREARTRSDAAEAAELSPAPPYLDFWHWLGETYEISNGGNLTLSREELADAEDWVKAIGTLFFDEFAPDADEIDFLTAW